MKPGCKILVYPRDVIVMAIRLETSVRELYENDGITTFINTMASLLGIQAGDLKVVQVFEGSAIIQVIINAEEDDEDSMTTLQTIEDTFVENASTFST